MASIISFTFREAIVDVEYHGEELNQNLSVMTMLFKSYDFFWKREFITFIGYLIPKGWKVLPLFRNIHHNPEFFPDPRIFDPSRFEVRDIKRKEIFTETIFRALVVDVCLCHVFIYLLFPIWVAGGCRLPPSPTLSCHLEMECMLALAMKLPSWRCLSWSII